MSNVKLPAMYAHHIGERVLYAPPKSVAFGHQSRVRDPRRAWPMVAGFMDAFALGRLAPGIGLDCYGVDESNNEIVVEERISEARRLFGPEKNPSTAPRHTRTWELQPEQLAVAIGFALDDDKWPKQELGPVRLHFRYHFLWRDLLDFASWQDVTELPLIDAWSSLGVSLGSQRVFLQPRLVFPLDYYSVELASFLMRIEEYIPFRLRDQYFKRWLRSKASTYGRVLKLDKMWRQPNHGLQRAPETGRR